MSNQNHVDALKRIIALDPEGVRGDDLGLAVRIAREGLALAPGLSGWQEIASAQVQTITQNEKMTAREGLNRFLDEAASKDYVFANIDAAELYVALFPDEQERAAAITAPGIAPHQPQPEVRFHARIKNQRCQTFERDFPNAEGRSEWIDECKYYDNITNIECWETK